MTLQDLLNFGFIFRETKPQEALKIDRHYVTRLIGFPHGFITLVSVDATNGEFWNVYKGNMQDSPDNFICTVQNIEQVKKTIFVLSSFKFDSFR